MDAFTLMKKDHRKVDELFKNILATTEDDLKKREKLFEELQYELNTHAFMEEKAFYPFFQEKATTHDIVLESFEEHHVVKLLLRELEKMKKDSEQWIAKLTVLKENVEHHVTEEETDLFPKVQQIISDEEAEELGKKMEATKKEYMIEK